MKRSWVSIVLVAGVFVLLTVFLGLQYRSLSEASEAERERMQRRVGADAARFAEEFNREMQAAYYNFHTDAAPWRQADWNELTERYEYWKSRTAYPELIRALYFVPKQADSTPLRHDPAKRSFEPAGLPREVEDLRPLFVGENFKQVYEDKFAMVMPVYDTSINTEHILLRRQEHDVEGPHLKLAETYGWLVVLLDEAVIRDRLLPDLAQKYFAGDYNMAVSDRAGRTIFETAGSPTGADATVSLFNMSPDNLLFFTSREALPKMVRERRSGVVINQRVESHTFSRTETTNNTTGTFELELKPNDGKSKPRATVVASTGPSADPWVLNVQHTAGSVDAFVTAERNKSLAVGLGIYLLIVGGVLAILLSALRSRRFAQRQIDFVSSVSHEFRTPLAVIYSAGENLADGVAKENTQVSRYGELIKGEGKKLSAMVEQILEFAGANSGKRKYNFVQSNVLDIVNEAIDECRPLIESGGFTLETDFPKDLPKIQADRGALAGALQNLIANSVKYSNGSKWIRISASNGGTSVKISVEDHGIGINNDDMRRVFEPFYRAREVVDAQISGNGLGLNLVRKVTEAHRGKVEVESTPGFGSKFTIELPKQN